LLTATIEASRKAEVIQARSIEKVIVDTRVMEKAISYPGDGKLPERSRQHLVRLAKRFGFRLRQNYNRIAPGLGRQAGRYAHAGQYRRMKEALKKLRTLAGRVWRDVERQAAELSGQSLLAHDPLEAAASFCLDFNPPVKRDRTAQNNQIHHLPSSRFRNSTK
jgi:IS5 family transposase